jgi:hypothetical protein
VVNGVETAIATGALFAPVGWIKGVAANFLGPALHDPHQNAVIGRAVVAEGGVPVVPAFDQVFRLEHWALGLHLPFSEDIASYCPYCGEASPGQEVTPC